MPISITNQNYQQEIVESSLPVIVDVYATWCGPCQQMAPLFEQLEQEHGTKYKFAKLNVDESRELAIKFGVTAIPTFVFIKDNEIKGKETGYIAKDDLLEKITELLA